jgi:SAM-dependent methyltransferase
MSIVERLRARMRRESFHPTLLAALLRSDYIIRRGLFLAIKSLASNISGNVLDFGCGSKPYQDLFTQAHSYVGVDLEVTGHDHSESRIDVFYDGKALPFKDGQFDAVVSFEVFEHVFNLPAVLLEINRVTRYSGYLLISLPFCWQEHEQPYDFARYTSFGISHILTQAGYEVIEIRKTTTYVLATFQMLLAYLALITQRKKVPLYLQQIFITFPCTLMAYAVNAVFPKRYEFFCNTVVLARKVTAPTPAK